VAIEGATHHRYITLVVDRNERWQLGNLLRPRVVGVCRSLFVGGSERVGGVLQRSQANRSQSRAVVWAKLFVPNHDSCVGGPRRRAHGYLFGPKICGRRCFNSASGEGNASRHTGGRTVLSVNTPAGAGRAKLGSVLGSGRNTRVPQMMFDVGG
jgi:hypothetical protein